MGDFYAGTAHPSRTPKKRRNGCFIVGFRHDVVPVKPTTARITIVLLLLLLSSSGVQADEPISPRPLLKAIRYGENWIELIGEKLFSWNAGWNTDHTVLTVEIPRALQADQVIEPVGASTFIRHVYLPTPPDDTKKKERPEKVTIRIELSSPATQTGYIDPNGTRIRIELSSLESETAARSKELVEEGERITKEKTVKEDEGFEAIELEYADADALAMTLRRLVQFGERVIQLDSRLNLLILDRSMERYSQLRRLVDQLDRPGEQILIDAQIVELHDNAASHLGLDLSSSISMRFGEQSQYYGEVPLPIQPIVRSPLEIIVTLDMLKGEGKARVLANPRVATIDGIPAVVRTEERFPVFVTQISGDQAYRIKQDIVAGISLSITPRHNRSGEITTIIKTDVTSITGTTSEGYPTTSTREVETTIRVRSGETIVIGGLLEEREIKHQDKVPLLGDIPLLGVLFRNYRTEKRETNLYVIVTPYLISGNKKMNPVSSGYEAAN